MNKLVQVEDRPEAGLALLTVIDFGQVYAGQLWARCRARSRGVCDATGERYEPGATVYRPIGNPANRRLRFLATRIESADVA